MFISSKTEPTFQMQQKKLEMFESPPEKPVELKELHQDFLFILSKYQNNQDLNSVLLPKIVKKSDKYGHILMHVACSYYKQLPTKENAQLLDILMIYYKKLNFNPNVDNKLGVTPAMIVGEIDEEFAKKLFYPG